MVKKLAHCAPVTYTMGHWVGHNKYIETLQILLHLIFIYLILHINKDTLSDLQQNSCFSCTVCAGAWLRFVNGVQKGEGGAIK